MIVHGEQRITLHRPLPVRARISAQARVTGVVDKGKERGALLYVETSIEEHDDRRPLATLLSTVFARGDGGFGGSSSAAIVPHRVPDRAPDLQFEAHVPFNQPFIYRLSGDRNPLHVDPASARAAGFERPILHGLSTYGMAVRSIIRCALANDSDRIEHVAARFSAPVFPGERVADSHLARRAAAFVSHAGRRCEPHGARQRIRQASSLTGYGRILERVLV